MLARKTLSKVSLLNSKMCLTFAALLLFPLVAFAHGLHHLEQSFQSGFSHPFSGLDHIFAMLSVGLLASQKSGRLSWRLPVYFLVTMCFGGGIGYFSASWPWVEKGILVSVFVLGLFLAYPKVAKQMLLVTLISLFAFCHGHAHGAGLHADQSIMPYVLGFLCSTAVLHGLGYALGKGFTHISSQIVRFTGLAFMFSTMWI